jgi:hypothetical protein
MMKKAKNKRHKEYRYEAPMLYVGVFYALLLAWTIVSVYLLGSKTLKVGWPLGQLLMIGFVLAYTWYFSLGISYSMKLSGNGDVNLKSFRRVLEVQAEAIEMVEGPRLALLPVGFLRFRLEREKAYLFCLITDENLQKILKTLRKKNPNMKFKGV